MVIDCTGHGVSGTFVTMLVKAIEEELLSKVEKLSSPALCLEYFNKRIKQILNQYKQTTISDVGFDGGILYYNKKEKIIKFDSANTPLFYSINDKITIIKEDRFSIGYVRSDENHKFKEYELKVKEGDKFYLTTDGYIDQNGGEKDLPFGKKRFMKLIEKYHHLPMKEQKEKFLEEFNKWKRDEQNDDITVIGFKVIKYK